MTNPNGDRFDELVTPFAAGIFALIDARRRSVIDWSPRQDARVREAVGVLLRKACDVAIPAARPPEVSREAAKAAGERGVNLRQQSWHSQRGFDPGRQRFHYEHKETIGSIAQQIVEAKGVGDVVDLMRQRLKVVWITKDEDRRLTELGFRSKRPDPEAAYAQAGIHLLTESDEAVDPMAAALRDQREACTRAALATVPMPDRYLRLTPSQISDRPGGHDSHNGAYLSWSWGYGRERGVFLAFLWEHRMTNMRAAKFFADGSSEGLPTPAEMRVVHPDPEQDRVEERNHLERDRRAYESLRVLGLISPADEAAGSHTPNEVTRSPESQEDGRAN